MRALTHAAQRQRLGLAARQQRAAQPQVTTLPPPYGGLNARDAISEMDPRDATRLDNWYPDFGKVAVRAGRTEFAALTGVATPVETVAELKLASGSRLLAAGGGGLWDVTAGGTIANALDSYTSFSNDRWQYAAMSAGGAPKLGLVNGEDAPQTFDGTAKANMTISSGDITVADIVGIYVFKSRSYFWTGTADFYHSAVNTLGGALVEFPLGDVNGVSGVIVAITSLTRDGGDGMDDLFVALMSSGQAVVYQGSDPESADDWSLVGVYGLGRVLGPRCAIKAGGDVVVASVDGYSLLSKSLNLPRGNRNATISDKIAKAAITAARDYGADFGWQAFHYPRGRCLWVNHPTGSVFFQHVVNLGTGAWCRFTGQPASCWSLFDDRPMFGGPAGKVYEADTGVTDAGAEIVADARQAFSYLGGRSRNVQVQLARPVLEATGEVDIEFGLAVDFDPKPKATVTRTLGVGAGTGSPWGSPWGTSSWGRPPQVVQGWFAHSARGYAIAPSLIVTQDTNRVSWNATSLSWLRVGPI